HVELSAPFREKSARYISVLEGRHRREEVAGIRQTVGSDRTPVRQLEGRAVVLANIGPGGLLDKFDAEDDAAGNDADFSRLYLNLPELREEQQSPFLRDDEIFPVGVEQIFVFHRLGDQHDMPGQAVRGTR